MGHFYGANLFLAESSATSGGLDSLLEPTGNIKKAQELAARAFGAERAYFATNGTSTSNKIVLQALLAPGDIVLVDRNCHKSHHYGMVLAGAQPLYVEAYPLTAYSMYGAVPLRTHQAGAARAQGRGQARSRAARRPHQLHLRRAHVQHAARDGGVPRDQAGPDLPVGRGVVRLRALLARSTAAAPAMGAAGRARGALRRPGLPRRVRGVPRAGRRARSADPRLLDMHLLPDPDKVRDPRLPDPLDAQVDVGAAPGLDDAGARPGLPPRRGRRSRRRSSPTRRPRRTSRSWPRSTSRGARWSSRATSSPCARPSSRSRSGARSTAIR